MFVAPLPRIPEPYEWHPSNYAHELSKKKAEMLLVCLGGGMSYADAKSACSLEYDDAIMEAQEEYALAVDSWLKKASQRKVNEAKPKIVSGFWSSLLGI